MNIEFTSPSLRDLEELRAWYRPRTKRGLANMLTESEETITRIPDQVSSGRPTPRDDVREKITRHTASLFLIISATAWCIFYEFTGE